MNELFSLREKVIVVTGGTGILGEAFCRGIAEAGGSVVILGRNEAVGRERAETLRAAGHQALFIRADVLSQAELEAACVETLQTYGRVDGLVNAAGGNQPGAVVQPGADVFSLDPTALRQVFDLNLHGTLLPTLAFGRHMATHGGSIVNISSMAAQRAITRVLGYSMAKAAVDNFTRWMAVELAHRYQDRLRINALAPGFFLTEQNRSLLTQPDGSPTARGQAVVQQTPFGRFGQPEELVGTLIWLLSGASRFVNGEVVAVDGGFPAFSGV